MFNVKHDSREVVRLARSLREDISDRADELVREATLATEADAKRLAPVDQGALRQGIFSKIEGKTGTVSTSPQTPYAVHVHNGHMVKAGQIFPLGNGEFRRIKETRFIAGQPFLAEAFEANERDFIKKAKQIIKQR